MARDGLGLNLLGGTVSVMFSTLGSPPSSPPVPQATAMAQPRRLPLPGGRFGPKRATTLGGAQREALMDL